MFMRQAHEEFDDLIALTFEFDEGVFQIYCRAGVLIGCPLARRRYVSHRRRKFGQCSSPQYISVDNDARLSIVSR